MEVVTSNDEQVIKKKTRSHVPTSITLLLKDLVKQAAKHNPEDIYDFCASYFDNLVEKRERQFHKNDSSTDFRSILLSKTPRERRIKNEEKLRKCTDDCKCFSCKSKKLKMIIDKSENLQTNLETKEIPETCYTPDIKHAESSPFLVSEDIGQILVPGMLPINAGSSRGSPDDSREYPEMDHSKAVISNVSLFLKEIISDNRLMRDSESEILNINEKFSFPVASCSNTNQSASESDRNSSDDHVNLEESTEYFEPDSFIRPNTAPWTEKKDVLPVSTSIDALNLISCKIVEGHKTNQNQSILNVDVLEHEIISTDEIERNREYELLIASDINHVTAIPNSSVNDSSKTDLENDSDAVTSQLEINVIPNPEDTARPLSAPLVYEKRDERPSKSHRTPAKSTESKQYIRPLGRSASENSVKTLQDENIPDLQQFVIPESMNLIDVADGAECMEKCTFDDIPEQERDFQIEFTEDRNGQILITIDKELHTAEGTLIRDFSEETKKEESQVECKESYSSVQNISKSGSNVEVNRVESELEDFDNCDLMRNENISELENSCHSEIEEVTRNKSILDASSKEILVKGSDAYESHEEKKIIKVESLAFSNCNSSMISEKEEISKSDIPFHSHQNENTQSSEETTGYSTTDKIETQEDSYTLNRTSDLSAIVKNYIDRNTISKSALVEEKPMREDCKTPESEEIGNIDYLDSFITADIDEINKLSRSCSVEQLSQIRTNSVTEGIEEGRDDKSNVASSSCVSSSHLNTGFVTTMNHQKCVADVECNNLEAKYGIDTLEKPEVGNSSLLNQVRVTPNLMDCDIAKGNIGLSETEQVRNDVNSESLVCISPPILDAGISVATYMNNILNTNMEELTNVESCSENCAIDDVDITDKIPITSSGILSDLNEDIRVGEVFKSSEKTSEGEEIKSAVSTSYLCNNENSNMDVTSIPLKPVIQIDTQITCLESDLLIIDGRDSSNDNRTASPFKIEEIVGVKNLSKSSSEEELSKSAFKVWESNKIQSVENLEAGDISKSRPECLMHVEENIEPFDCKKVEINPDLTIASSRKVISSLPDDDDLNETHPLKPNLQGGNEAKTDSESITIENIKRDETLLTPHYVEKFPLTSTRVETPERGDEDKVCRSEPDFDDGEVNMNKSQLASSVSPRSHIEYSVRTEDTLAVSGKFSKQMVGEVCEGVNLSLMNISTITSQARGNHETCCSVDPNMEIITSLNTQGNQNPDILSAPVETTNTSVMSNLETDLEKTDLDCDSIEDAVELAAEETLSYLSNSVTSSLLGPDFHDSNKRKLSVSHRTDSRASSNNEVNSIGNISDSTIEPELVNLVETDDDSLSCNDPDANVMWLNDNCAEFNTLNNCPEECCSSHLNILVNAEEDVCSVQEATETSLGLDSNKSFMEGNQVSDAEKNVPSSSRSVIGEDIFMSIENTDSSNAKITVLLDKEKFQDSSTMEFYIPTAGLPMEQTAIVDVKCFLDTSGNNTAPKKIIGRSVSVSSMYENNQNTNTSECSIPDGRKVFRSHSSISSYSEYVRNKMQQTICERSEERGIITAANLTSRDIMFEDVVSSSEESCYNSNSILQIQEDNAIITKCNKDDYTNGISVVELFILPEDPLNTFTSVEQHQESDVIRSSPIQCSVEPNAIHKSSVVLCPNNSSQETIHYQDCNDPDLLGGFELYLLPMDTQEERFQKDMNDEIKKTRRSDSRKVESQDISFRNTDVLFESNDMNVAVEPSSQSVNNDCFVNSGCRRLPVDERSSAGSQHVPQKYVSSCEGGRLKSRKSCSRRIPPCSGDSTPSCSYDSASPRSKYTSADERRISRASSNKKQLRTIKLNEIANIISSLDSRELLNLQTQLSQGISSSLEALSITHGPFDLERSRRTPDKGYFDNNATMSMVLSFIAGILLGIIGLHHIQKSSS